MDAARDRPIAVWLLSCCVCVWIVLVTGGATRLTRSGLSIVEWKPVVGVVPPLSRAAWEAEFQKYRGTPEWLAVNAGMTLDGFKAIYWMEYAHRLLARLAGLAFVLPLLYFALRGRISRAFLPRLAFIAGCWALQGAVGWFMVASGLVHVPRVSPYRLTAHLLVACFLYGAMLWTALDLLEPRPPGAPRAGGRPCAWLLALGVLTIASGGLVAGLKAGFLYNTFPKMLGHWLPPGLLELKPPLLNLFENELTVQFDHRVLALALLASTLAFWRRSRRRPDAARERADVLLALVGLQIALGIATLLLHVPVPLGALHQANALAVLTALLYVAHQRLEEN